jgi:predicted phosphodiesterase
MRLAILADTHGNRPALEAVLADVERNDVDRILVAGDLTGGPHSVETIRMLRALGATLIRGNSDNGPILYAAGQGPAAWRTDRQFALLRWGQRFLDGETLAWLAGLPEQRTVALPGAAPIRLVHGSPRHPTEPIIPDDPTLQERFRAAALTPRYDPPLLFTETLTLFGEPVLVCGHTHFPWQAERGGRLVLNPGAVCGPLNGDTGAQYALLTWDGGRWQAEHRSIPYDLARIRADFEESGLLSEGGPLARAFLLSIERGDNVGMRFLDGAYALAAQAGYPGGETIPDAVWEQAAATWDWERYEDHLLTGSPEPPQSPQG